jgi:hypothetical protein
VTPGVRKVLKIVAMRGPSTWRQIAMEMRSLPTPRPGTGSLRRNKFGMINHALGTAQKLGFLERSDRNDPMNALWSLTEKGREAA